MLVVEDDAAVAEVLSLHLAREGFSVRVVTTAAAVAPAVEEFRPHVVLLDLLLPDGSGKDVCRGLKSDARSQGVAVVMLTALGDEIDRVVGLELGADDYVAKPFSPRELVLRLRAVLRRRAPRPPPERLWSLGRLTIDVEARRVYVDAVEVRLSPLEYRILALLAERRDRMQSREAIELAVWGRLDGDGGRRVDTHVARLRRKLGDARGYLRTDRAVGYGLAIDPEGHARA